MPGGFLTTVENGEDLCSTQLKPMCIIVTAMSHTFMLRENDENLLRGSFGVESRRVGILNIRWETWVLQPPF